MIDFQMLVEVNRKSNVLAFWRTQCLVRNASSLASLITRFSSLWSDTTEDSGEADESSSDKESDEGLNVKDIEQDVEDEEEESVSLPITSNQQLDHQNFMCVRELRFDLPIWGCGYRCGVACQ